MKTITSKRIVVDPSIRGGRPHLAQSRITVADVVLMHLRLGKSLEEIAGKYDLPLAALYTAMAYYYDHQEEIDRSIHEDAELGEAFRQRNPSPLQKKLTTLQHGE
jgi:uncharacterized protein (DUF433 family)